MAHSESGPGWIVLVDGTRHQLDLTHAETARRPVTVRILLDIVHVSAHVWTAAHAFHPPGTAEAEAWAGHLTSRLDQLHYDTALATGWPVATGAIEGAYRHLIGDRLDITDARWGLNGAEAILKLRAPHDNGDFAEYRTFHLTQSTHVSTHPGPAQLPTHSTTSRPPRAGATPCHDAHPV